MTELLLTKAEIIESINEGRKKNKRDRRDGILITVAPEYMQDKSYVLKAQATQAVKAVFERIWQYGDTTDSEMTSVKFLGGIMQLKQELLDEIGGER